MNSSTTALGRQAETAAADYLAERGWTIIARNWRVKAAEIDIVAKHEEKIYFVEVKYRKSDTAGAGLDYINPPKLKRMRRAAALWLLMNESSQASYELAAIEVTGLDFKISAWLPALT